MIKTNPTGAELQATLDLLSVLALAKDADALAATVGELKAAQDAAEERRLAATAAIADLDAKAAEIARDRGIADGELERAADQISKAQKLFEDASNDREMARQERVSFDFWMAGERQKLVESAAQLAARESVVVRREDEARAAVEAAEVVRQRGLDAQAEAELLRSEYEQRMAALRATVLGAPPEPVQPPPPPPAPAPEPPPAEPVIEQPPVVEQPPAEPVTEPKPAE